VILVRSAPEQVEMTRVELDALLDSRFTFLKRGAGGGDRLKMTAAGRLPFAL